MGHVPHLLLPQPWEGPTLPLPPTTLHHLRKVLRIGDREPVTYTDGQGGIGSGLIRSSAVERGSESIQAEPPRHITIAVAPPHDKDRLRFMVEKLSELEVRRLLWLRTRFGGQRLPDPARARSWAQAGLEQSRGAWLMEVVDDWVEPVQLSSPLWPHPVWVANAGADPPRTVPDQLIVAVGPEGGWAPGEIPETATRFGLGRTILRVETAAIGAAARFLS